jgi:elongation factor G
MKEYQAADIRNVAIVGHASSGKTMLSESMLACAGVINRMGSIPAGTTVSDYHESEQQRQISVSTTLMHLEWLGKKVNLLDCPVTLISSAKRLSPARQRLRVINVHANHGVE